MIKSETCALDLKGLVLVPVHVLRSIKGPYFMYFEKVPILCTIKDSFLCSLQIMVPHSLSLSTWGVPKSKFSFITW